MLVLINLASTVSLDCHGKILSRHIVRGGPGKKIYTLRKENTCLGIPFCRGGIGDKHETVFQPGMPNGTNKTQAVAVEECQCCGLARKVEG